MKNYIKVFLMIIMVGALFTSCKKKSDVVTLNVFNWGDYIDQEILEEFTKETGIKVNYETYPSNEDMYLKIKSGGTDYDIIFPSDYMIEKMTEEDLLQKIDLNKIPNFSNISENFKDLSYDSKNQYSVPYTWGTVGILYNKDIVKEPVDSWGILWDKKYKNQILMYDSQRDSLMVALKYLGYSMNTKSIEELNEARDLLIKQKPLVLSYAGDDGKGMMEQEEAGIFVTYSGDAMEILDNYDNFSYVIPKEGSNIWYDCIAIPKRSKNVDAAHKFINFMSKNEIAKKNFDYLLYSSVNKNVINTMDNKYKKMISVNPDKNLLKKCEIFEDPKTFIEEFNRAWTEIKAASY